MSKVSLEKLLIRTWYIKMLDLSDLRSVQNMYTENISDLVVLVLARVLVKNESMALVLVCSYFFDHPLYSLLSLLSILEPPSV